MALLDLEKLTETQREELSIDALLETRAMLTILLARQAAADAAAKRTDPEQELQHLANEINATKRAYLLRAGLPMLDSNPAPEEVPAPGE